MLAAGLLSLPLVTTLALHPSQPLKAWAGHVHRALSPAPAPALQPSQAEGAPPGSPASATLYGLPCLMHQATTLLAHMWHWGQAASPHSSTNHHAGTAEMSQLNLGIDQAPMAWLGRFQKALQTLCAAEKQPEQGQERRVSDQQNEVVRMILTALLDHPLPEVQAAAAESCADAVLAFPIAGISLLPLLLHRLQLSVAISAQGESCMKLNSEPAVSHGVLARRVVWGIELLGNQMAVVLLSHS